MRSSSALRSFPILYCSCSFWRLLWHLRCLLIFELSDLYGLSLDFPGSRIWVPFCTAGRFKNLNRWLFLPVASHSWQNTAVYSKISLTSSTVHPHSAAISCSDFPRTCRLSTCFAKWIPFFIPRLSALPICVL